MTMLYDNVISNDLPQWEALGLELRAGEQDSYPADGWADEADAW